MGLCSVGFLPRSTFPLPPCPSSLPGQGPAWGLELAGSAVGSKACCGRSSHTPCCAFLCGCRAHFVTWPQVGGRKPWGPSGGCAGEFWVLRHGTQKIYKPNSILISYFLCKPTFYPNKLFPKVYRLAQGQPSRPLAKPGLLKPGSAAMAGDVALGPRRHRAEEQPEQEPLSPHTVVGGNQAAGRWLYRLKEHILRRAKWAISGLGSRMGGQAAFVFIREALGPRGPQGRTSHPNAHSVDQSSRGGSLISLVQPCCSTQPGSCLWHPNKVVPVLPLPWPLWDPDDRHIVSGPLFA